MQPGLYADITLSTYHTAPGLSKSDLDLIARSPAHYRYGHRKETPTLRLGTAVHSCILEPDTWERRYVRAQGRRRTVETDRTVLTATEWELCLHLRDVVWNHPTCQNLLSEGTAESSAWWLDPETQLLCKCRPDWSRPGLLLDFKTTRDASPAGFARAVERYRYHVQAAYALDGWQAAGGDPIEQFLLVAMEKTPPFAVALYELPATALAAGRALYRRDLTTVAECLSRQHWPGYPTAIMTLAMGDGRLAPGILF